MPRGAAHHREHSPAGRDRAREVCGGERRPGAAGGGAGPDDAHHHRGGVDGGAAGEAPDAHAGDGSRGGCGEADAQGPGRAPQRPRAAHLRRRGRAALVPASAGAGAGAGAGMGVRTGMGLGAGVDASGRAEVVPTATPLVTWRRGRGAGVGGRGGAGQLAQPTSARLGSPPAGRSGRRGRCGLGWWRPQRGRHRPRGGLSAVPGGIGGRVPTRPPPAPSSPQSYGPARRPSLKQTCLPPDFDPPLPPSPLEPPPSPPRALLWGWMWGLGGHSRKDSQGAAPCPGAARARISLGWGGEACRWGWDGEGRLAGEGSMCRALLSSRWWPCLSSGEAGGGHGWVAHAPVNQGLRTCGQPA